MAQRLNDSLKAIERYKHTSPHYEELLDILGDILILREEYRRKVQEDICAMDEKLLATKLTGGMPLVDFMDGVINLDEPKKYFMSLLELAEKRELGEAHQIREDLEAGTIDFESMVRSSFDAPAVDEAEDESEEDIFDLLGFLVEESLRPSLEVLAEKYAEVIDGSTWSEGYCPLCGREPKISQLKNEEGEKYLFCGQCGIQWRYPRLKCPFCENEDQQTLAFFTVEDEEQHRVDVCNVCNRYIKTIDVRKSNENPNLDVEDIATLHLDMLANEEGYD